MERTHLTEFARRMMAGPEAFSLGNEFGHSSSLDVEARRGPGFHAYAAALSTELRGGVEFPILRTARLPRRPGQDQLSRSWLISPVVHTVSEPALSRVGRSRSLAQACTARV